MSDNPPVGDTLLLEMRDPGIALCTFNRPEKRNALSQEMVDDLRSLLQWLGGREDTRCLVFTGSEKSFVAGADIAELRARGRMDALRRINSRLFREIETFALPTIAAIRGHALGGGCELALACDLRICGRGAKLGQPEVGLGILPGAGATYRLPRLVGPGLARELIFTGRIVEAEEAHRIGLVNSVVDDDRVVAAAVEMGASIARNGALAVRLAKQALLQAGEGSIEAGMALESTSQAVLFEDEEKKRRMTAFLEKRASRG